MNEIKAPKDMFVATLEAPQAKLSDFLLNDINANNTELLTPDEYKSKPFIKKRYTKDGVFDEGAFMLDYQQAYDNFTKLSDSNSYTNLIEDIEYSKHDRFAPIGGKIWDTTPEFKKLRNPLQLQYSVEGINTVSDPLVTPEEAAQSNFIFDPKTGKFTNKTPEGLSILDKTFGLTLVYAAWDEDGVDPTTGERHYKGQYKTDENGNYYTEYLGDRDLRNKKVVALLDILTDEGSFANRFDFFDSDDEDKSNWGIAFKTLVMMAPYLIPGVREYYALMHTIASLAAVMPTFFKAFDNLIIGNSSNSFSRGCTYLENWFRKFDVSRTNKSREGFWNFENLGALVVDTYGQLYQQRAVANWVAKSKLLKVKTPNLNLETANEKQLASYFKELQEAGLKQNKRISAATLGYMGLISAADVYNDALNAGYNERVAGLTALASAGALFGIMQYNESMNGIGTWFLDKTTGYNKDLNKGVVKLVAKDTMKLFEDGFLQLSKGDPAALQSAFSTFKRNTLSKIQDALAVGGEEIWKSALVEGVEEVTEEAVQDTIKGIIDACNYIGWNSDASFGGWDNVFSKEGISRYLATFAGGAIGGSIFAGQQQFEERFLQTPTGKKVKYDLILAVLDGRGEQVINEINKGAKKYFNNKQSAKLTEINGQQYYLSAGDNEATQADLIADLATKMVRHLMSTVQNIVGDKNQYNPGHKMVYEQIAEAYRKSGFQDKYVKKIWDNTVANTVSAIDSLNQLRSLEGLNSETSAEAIKLLEEKIKSQIEDLHNWQNGKNFTDFTLDALIMLNPLLADRLLKLSKEAYAKTVLGVDYNNLDPNGEWTLEKITKQWESYKKTYDPNDLINSLPKVREIFKKLIPTVAAPLRSFIANGNNKLWLKSSGQFDENGTYIPNPLALTEQQLTSHEVMDNEGNGFYIADSLLPYLEQNPMYWSLSKRVKYDLASELEKKDPVTGVQALDFSSFDDSADIVKALINDLAIHSGVNIWTTESLLNLVEQANKILKGDVEDNIFYKALLEKQLEKEEKEKDKPSKDKELIKISTGLSTANLASVSPRAQTIKLQTILDVISDTDEFVDDELYHMLETALKAMLYQNLLRDITSFFQNVINVESDNGTYVTYNLSKLIINNLFKNNLVFTNQEGENIEIPAYNTDFSELSSNNIIEKFTDLLGLFNHLKTYLNSPTNSLNDLDYDKFERFICKLDNEVELPLSVIISMVDVGLTGSLINTVTALKEQGILPPELQTQWNNIRTKNRRSNPLLDILKGIVYKFGKNYDNLLEFLFSKESIIRNSGSLELTSVDHESIADIEAAIEIAYSLLACTEEGGNAELFENIKPYGLLALPLSFNSVVKNYATLYGGYSENDAADLYPIFSKQETKYAADVLEEVARKLEVLKQLSKETVEANLRNDSNNRKAFIINFARKLKENDSFAINDRLLWAVKYDADNPEKYITECLLQLHSNVLDLLKSGVSIEEIINLLIAKFPDRTWQTRKSTSESVTQSETDGYIADSLIFEYLIESIALDPYVLLSSYKKAIANKLLLPRWDQELLFRSALAKAVNPELYATAASLLHLKYNQDSNGNPNKRDLADGYLLTYFSGPAGSGKTTALLLVIDGLLQNSKSIEYKKIYLTAPTKDKVSDLHKNLKSDPSLPIQEDLETILDLLDILNLDDKFKNEVNNRLSNLTDEELKTDGTLELGQIDLDNGNNVTVSINLKNGVLKDIKITNLNLSVKLDNLKDNFKNSILIIDESTNLSIFTLSVLNEIAKDSNTLVYMAGDEAQIGLTFNLSNGIKLTSNISSFYTHRSHILSSNLRGLNSGKKTNLERVRGISSKYIDTELSTEYDIEQERKKIKTYFQNSPLTYKGVQGDKIARKSDVKDSLKEIALEVNNGKTFFVILKDLSDKDKVQEMLREAGFKPEIYNFDEYYKTLESVLGAEADFCFIYNLTSENTIENGNSNYDNGDIDLSKIYTAISRSKEGSLIYEDEPHGLFSEYDITSILDNSISEYYTDTIVYQTKTEERIKELNKALEGLSALKLDQVEEEEDLELEEEVNDLEQDGNNLLESDDTPPNAIPLDDSTNNKDNSIELESKEIDSEKEDRNNRAKELLLGNASLIYFYYIRLGLEPEIIKRLKDAQNSLAVQEIMEEVGNTIESDNNEKAKDLYAYYKARNGRVGTGIKLINDFLELRNRIIYNRLNKSEELTSLVLNFKIKDNTDLPYLKPNNKEEEIGANKINSSVLAEVQVNGSTIYVTIAKIGYNKEGENFYSEYISKYLLVIRNGLKLVSIRIGRSSHNSVGRKNYYEWRQLSDKIGKINNDFLNDFILMTGLRDFQMDPSIKSNLELFPSDANTKYGRVTYQELQNLGYDLIPMFEGEKASSLDEFWNKINSHRLVPLSNDAKQRFEGIWDKPGWYIAVPKGLNSNSLFGGIVFMNTVSPNKTVLESLSTNKGRLNAFGMKLLFSFLSWYTGYNQVEGNKFLNLSSRLKKGKKYGYEVIKSQVKAWQDAISDFLNWHLDNKDTLKNKLDKPTINFIQKLFIGENAEFFQFLPNTGSKKFFKFCSKKAVKDSIEILDNAKYDGFIFLPVNLSTNKDDMVTTRVFEGPVGILNFAEFNQLQQIDELGAQSTIGQSTVEELEPSGENKENPPVQTVPSVLPKPNGENTEMTIQLFLLAVKNIKREEDITEDLIKFYKDHIKELDDDDLWDTTIGNKSQLKRRLLDSHCN